MIYYGMFKVISDYIMETLMIAAIKTFLKNYRADRARIAARCALLAAALRDGAKRE